MWPLIVIAAISCRYFVECDYWQRPRPPVRQARPASVVIRVVNDKVPSHPLAMVGRYPSGWP